MNPPHPSNPNFLLSTPSYQELEESGKHEGEQNKKRKKKAEGVVRARALAVSFSTLPTSAKHEIMPLPSRKGFFFTKHPANLMTTQSLKTRWG